MVKDLDTANADVEVLSESLIKILKGRKNSLTISGGVAQDLCNLFVGWVLSQCTHNVCNLVVGYFAVTNSVEKSEGLPVIWNWGDCFS